MRHIAFNAFALHLWCEPNGRGRNTGRLAQVCRQEMIQLEILTVDLLRKKLIWT
jgi:hypothetical protein